MKRQYLFLLLAISMISCKNSTENTRNKQEATTAKPNDLSRDGFKGKIKTIKTQFYSQPYQKFDEWQSDNLLLEVTKTYNRSGYMELYTSNSYVYKDHPETTHTSHLTDSTDNSIVHITTDNNYIGFSTTKWENDTVESSIVKTPSGKIESESKNYFTQNSYWTRSEEVFYDSTGKMSDHTATIYQTRENGYATSFITVNLIAHDTTTFLNTVISKDKTGNPLKVLLKHSADDTEPSLLVYSYEYY